MRKKKPLPAGKAESGECLISRFGNTEIIQTKDSIRIQERCKCRQGSDPGDDLNKSPSA